MRVLGKLLRRFSIKCLLRFGTRTLITAMPYLERKKVEGNERQPAARYVNISYAKALEGCLGWELPLRAVYYREGPGKIVPYTQP